MNEMARQLVALLESGDFCAATKFMAEHLKELPDWMQESIKKMVCEFVAEKRAN